ncbi:MAG: MBL fold metallo-hydrolase [Anaerolineae bacterium]|jgi:glyoxylase-like metal-dependent hydrolase (beta-lactamase superfamily II)
MIWHTITPIAQDVYQISEPVGAIEPRFGVKTVNSYLVVGRERAALIDSGLGIGDLRAEVEKVTSLPCLVLNTHSHWDHIGANAQFDETAVHEMEAEQVAQEPNVAAIRKAMRKPAAQAALPPAFDPAGYRVHTRPVTRILHDNDRVDLGDRSLRVLHMPGHSPGHVAYHDKPNGLLFTGDTACLSPVYACFAGGDPAALLDSAQRMASLPGVQTVCPGHDEVIAEEGWLGAFAANVEAAVSGQVEGTMRDGFIKGQEFRFRTGPVWLPA